jgi:tetratricopeptide (TPR) repeat protein
MVIPRHICFGLLLLLWVTLSSCQTGGLDNRPPTITQDPTSEVTAMRVQNYHSAAFLVGQFSLKKGELAVAANAFTNALAKNQNDAYLLNLAFQTQYFSGDIKAASDLAARIERGDNHVTMSSEPAAALAALQKDWEALYALADHLKSDSQSHAIGTIMASWALAAQGQGDAGLIMLKEIDPFENEPDSITFLSQQALMAEYTGQEELAVSLALEIMDREISDQGVILEMAGVLLRHDEAETGKEWIARLGPRFHHKRILANIANGTSGLLTPPNELEAIASGMVISQTDLNANWNQPISLAQLHLASYLDSGNDEARYLIGANYIDANLIDDGIAVLSTISPESPWFEESRLMMISALRYDPGQLRFVRELIQTLIHRDPDNYLLWLEKGLTEHANGHERKAQIALQKAIDLGFENGRAYYFLAITQANQNMVEDAEASFYRSISLSPFNAYTHNYFGYWLIEQNRNLDEAKVLIQKAVNRQPNNGAFVDSLGWVYYKLGDLDKALLFMERAATLIPDDPVITDHLGDVYWALGRKDEAMHEWRRAKLFSPDAALEAAILDKMQKALSDD